MKVDGGQTADCGWWTTKPWPATTTKTRAEPKSCTCLYEARRSDASIRYNNGWAWVGSVVHQLSTQQPLQQPLRLALRCESAMRGVVS